jgi:hypothetical protein
VGEFRGILHWRVINANGSLFSRFPGGLESQAAQLRREGFTVEWKGKVGGQNAIGTGVIGGMLSATFLAVFSVAVIRLFRVNHGR